MGLEKLNYFPYAFAIMSYSPLFAGRLLSRLSTRIDLSRSASIASFRTALSRGSEGSRMAIAGGRAISKGKLVGMTLGGAAGGILSKELLEELVEFFKSKTAAETSTPTPSQEHFDAISMFSLSYYQC